MTKTMIAATLPPAPTGSTPDPSTRVGAKSGTSTVGSSTSNTHACIREFVKFSRMYHPFRPGCISPFGRCISTSVLCEFDSSSFCRLVALTKCCQHVQTFGFPRLHDDTLFVYWEITKKHHHHHHHHRHLCMSSPYILRWWGRRVWVVLPRLDLDRSFEIAMVA